MDGDVRKRGDMIGRQFMMMLSDHWQPLRDAYGEPFPSSDGPAKQISVDIDGPNQPPIMLTVEERKAWLMPAVVAMAQKLDEIKPKAFVALPIPQGASAGWNGDFRGLLLRMVQVYDVENNKDRWRFDIGYTD